MRQQDDNAIRPVNPPRPIEILANPRGVPAMVAHGGQQLRISAVLDVWRIDDEWWRDEIGRRYFHVLLDDGTEASIYHDLVSGQWYEQRY